MSPFAVIFVLFALLSSVTAEAEPVGKFQIVSTTTHFKTPRNTDVIPAKAGISLISRVNQSKLFFIPLNDEAREYLHETVGLLKMPRVNGEEIPSLASIKSGEAPSGRLGSLPFANCMEMDQSEFEKTVAWASCVAGVENPLKAPRGREHVEETYLKPPSDEPSEGEVRGKMRERLERVGWVFSISGHFDETTGKGSLDIIDRIREIFSPAPPPPPPSTDTDPFRPPPPPPPPPPDDTPPADDTDGDDDGDGDGEDPKTQPDPNAPSDPNPDCMDEDEVMSDVERGSPTYGLTNPVEGTLSGRLGRFAACIMEAELVPQISYCRTDEVAHCDNETGTCTCRPLEEEGEGEPQSFQCQAMNIDCATNPTHDCCQG